MEHEYLRACVGDPGEDPIRTPIVLRLPNNGQWGLTEGLTQHADIQHLCGLDPDYLLCSCHTQAKGYTLLESQQ